MTDPPSPPSPEGTDEEVHARGAQTMAALMGVRALLVQVHGLLSEASRRLGDKGWTRGSQSQKTTHLSNRADSPNDWMPTYLMRWYLHPERPGVRLVVVVHLATLDDVPEVPLVAAGAFIGTERPATGPGQTRLTDTDAAGFGADLHTNPEETPPNGRVIRRPWDTGEVVSLAVPLFSIDGPGALQAKVLGPLLAEVAPEG